MNLCFHRYAIRPGQVVLRESPIVKECDVFGHINRCLLSGAWNDLTRFVAASAGLTFLALDPVSIRPELIHGMGTPVMAVGALDILIRLGFGSKRVDLIHPLGSQTPAQRSFGFRGSGCGLR